MVYEARVSDDHDEFASSPKGPPVKFDFRFYAYCYPDVVAETGRSAAALEAEFRKRGWREGRDPSPFFSTTAYLERNGDVAAADIDPFAHYRNFGREEGRSVILSRWGEDPAFEPVTLVAFEDTKRQIDVAAVRADPLAPRGFEDGVLRAWHLAVGRHVAATRDDADHATVRAAFDAEHYRRASGLDRSDEALLHHFMTRGWKDGLDPSPAFSVAHYLSTYADIAEAEINPFVHYLRHGRDEGRTSLPEDRRVVAPASEDVPPGPDHDAVRGVFDPTFYRETHGVEGDDDALLHHFMTEGWRAGLDPSPAFSVTHYLRTYPDIAEGGINPLLHYVIHGRGEGRTPHPGFVDPGEMDAVRGAFDPAFYRETHGVEGDDDALLRHFMSEGWRAGLDPSTAFSVSHYLQTYPDIARGGINPLLHYVLHGRGEGRRPLPHGPIRMRRDPAAALAPDMPLRLPATAATPPEAVDPSRLDLHWVIPDFVRGGGGHMTIFRTIRYLEQFGHAVTIWIERPVAHEDGRAAWEDIVKHFQCVGATVRFAEDGLAEARGDVVIATGWSTAWTIRDLTGFAAKMYFVQDHEPQFYATGWRARLAEETYRFGFGCICAGPWLEEIVSTRYGGWARSFDLAYEPDQYAVAAEETAEEEAGWPHRIAVYARDHTPRRCVPLALEALRLLARRRDDIEVHFFGQDTLPFAATPFAALNHGVLEAEDLAALYNRCDLGITFSGTNYSLVPQEMMAAGLPVVELDGPNTRAVFPEDAVALCGPDPRDIAARVDALLDDADAREALAAGGRAWVRAFAWEDSARAVEAAIRDFLAARDVPLAAPAVVPGGEAPLLDVVIPTWNAMAEMPPVLDALRGQRIADRMRILCVDSSSTDGTTEWLRAQPDVALDVIPQSEFQHGRTRNHAIAMGSAPIAAVLTQDAKPAGPDWAGDIVTMMNAVPEAAGLFGRHVAYPHHSRMVREEIDDHFRAMLKHPLVLSKHTDPERWASGEVGWRQFLHFYSDNNSAMRRSVWRDMPYPEVDYGEDQVWARDIVEAGHAKLYAPSVVVYHSHDYGPEETYARARTESAFFFEQFGYELGRGSEADLEARIAREQDAVARRAAREGHDPAEIAVRVETVAAKHRGWRDGLMQRKDIHTNGESR